MAIDLNKYKLSSTTPQSSSLNLDKYRTNQPLSQQIWNGIVNQTSTPAVSQQETPGYFSRLGTAYTEGAKNIQEGLQQSAEQIVSGAEKASTSPIRGALESLGGIARAGLRTVGQVAQTAFSPITEALAPVVEPLIKKGIESSPLLQSSVQKVSELANKYPEYAKDIQNIIDIATLGVGSAAEKPAIEATGKVAGKAATALEESAIAQKNKFAQELIKPIETKTVKEAQVARTTETGKGIFKKSIIEPTTQEKNMIKYVSEIPEVSPTKTFQQNYNIISDYNIKEAQSLAQKIEQNPFLVPRKETISKLNVAAESLSKSPLIVGDAEKTANRLIEGAKKFVNENEGTGAGILKARKEYDQWVLSQKPKAFDATAENAFTLANREIRNTFNTILDSKAPNLEIKQSLQKQSALFNALDSITPKAAEEANTAIGRFLQNAGKILGTKNKAVQIAAATAGIGGLGAAATFAPAVAIAGVPTILLYQGGKLLLKPEVRLAVAKVLREIESLSKGAEVIPSAEINKIKELLKDETGSINFGAEVGIGKSASKIDDVLLQEAKKYKSAEEFVKNSSLKVEYARNKLKVAEDGKPITVTVYHGSPDARFAEEFNPNQRGYFKNAPNLLPDNTQWNSLYGSTGGGFKSGKGVYDGISFTDDVRVAKSYSEKPAFDSENSVPMVLERTVTLNKPKVIDVANGEWKMSLEKTIELAKQEGYDGIVFKNIKDNYHPWTTKNPSNNIIAFSENQIKTKSQLTDIWNKANKK